MMMKLISEELVKENIALVGRIKSPDWSGIVRFFGGDTISGHATISDKPDAWDEIDCSLKGFDIVVMNQEKIVTVPSAFLLIQRRENGKARV